MPRFIQCSNVRTLIPKNLAVVCFRQNWAKVSGCGNPAGCEFKCQKD
jgi:hypothetical protein